MLSALRLCLYTSKQHQSSTVVLSRKRTVVSTAWYLRWLLTMAIRNQEPHSCWSEAYTLCRRTTPSTGLT